MSKYFQERYLVSPTCPIRRIRDIIIPILHVRKLSNSKTITAIRDLPKDTQTVMLQVRLEPKSLVQRILIFSLSK